jgi:hypothetical protein
MSPKRVRTKPYPVLQAVPGLAYLAIILASASVIRTGTGPDVIHKRETSLCPLAYAL